MAIHTRTAQINHAVLNEHISPFKKVFNFPTVLGLWNLETVPGLVALDGEIIRHLI